MVRLGIRSVPEQKSTYARRRRSDIVLPKERSNDLAEFFGIMFGDGTLSYYQVAVNLGTKEATYATSVSNIVQKLFGVRPKISIRKSGYRDVYLGSSTLTDWLREEGLVHNKVKAQIDAPAWIFLKKEYMERFLRGFFDTDGSVYKLRFGIQLSFTNRSIPLLNSLRSMLMTLGYCPSVVSGYRFYITNRSDVVRFFREISPANIKHCDRFKKFIAKFAQVDP